MKFGPLFAWLLAAGMVAGRVAVRAADADALQFIQPEFQLGTVPYDQDVPLTFELTNRSDRAVTITYAGATCHCTTVAESPDMVPAHGRVALEVVFNTSRDDGPVTQDIVVETADGQTLTGEFNAWVLLSGAGATNLAGPVPFSQASDEFSGPALGAQWQWNAFPPAGRASFSARPGRLRLASVPAPVTRHDGPPAVTNRDDAPNFLLQRFPAPEFTVTTLMEFAPAADGEFAGLAVSGDDHAMLGLRRTAGGLRLVYVVNPAANRPGAAAREISGPGVTHAPVYLRVNVRSGATCQFAWSFDNQSFTNIGGPFQASGGRWMGARVGLFASAEPSATQTGHADFGWFHVTPLAP